MGGSKLSDMYGRVKTGNAAAAVILSFALAASVAAQMKDDIIPGAVRLNNGMILRGLCSSGHSITASPVPDNRLDLRKIDQGFRVYYVATHQSDRIIPDNLAVPANNFQIVQRSASQKPMNYAIGLHPFKPFQPDGRSQVTLNLGSGQTVDIDVGIIGLDSRFAKVRGLTHRWTYGISMSMIPDGTLYAGSDAPGLLKLVRGFEDGENRLNLVQMLMEAGKYAAAKQLMTDIQNEFPELQQRCERSAEIWNDLVGDRVLNELSLLKDAGKHDTARNYARKWPDEKLDPVIRVKAKQFLDEIEEEDRRLETISRSLDMVVSNTVDPVIRRQAMQMCIELRRDLDSATLPRFAAYELLWQDPGLSADSKLALAVTGWLLGSDNAIDEFPEAWGLFQIRFLLLDYLRTTEDEASLRDELMERMRGLEGFTVQRLGQLIQFLPADDSLRLDAGGSGGAQRFEIEAEERSVACLGQVPGEYTTTRRYPLLIAFPRGGGTAAMTLAWWSEQADRHGYVLAVPQIYGPEDGAYDASAKQHQQVLDMIRRLKTSLSIDDDRVFIVGHGIGGEASMDIASAHPDLFAGVVSLAGLGRKHLLWTVRNSTSLPWYVVVGTRQPFYAARMILLLRKLFDRVPSTGRVEYCNAMLASYPERGFESYVEELPNLFQWMSLQTRPEYSDRISAATLKSTDRSWYWLELDSIADRFVSMDEPSTYDDAPSGNGRVEAEINGNLVRIRSLPGDATLRLSPDLPEVNLGEPIRILRSGSRSQKIDYKPSTRDLLEDFRLRRDRARLCYMKVPVGR